MLAPPACLLLYAKDVVPKCSLGHTKREIHLPEGPDFIGVGVARSATSWVAARLAEHPQIYFRKKAIKFWTKHFHRGYAWYHDHFKDRGDRIAGEFSAYYFITPRPQCARLEHYPKWSLPTFVKHLTRPHPPARDEIKKAYPGVKVFAVFRNPIDRAWSRYWKWVRRQKRKGQEHRIPFEQMLRDNGCWLQLMFCYGTLLRYWLEAFPDMGIFLHDDLIADKKGFMASMYRFLGVDDSFVGNLDGRENVADYEPMDAATRRRLCELYTDEIREFFRLIGRELDWLA